MVVVLKVLQNSKVIARNFAAHFSLFRRYKSNKSMANSRFEYVKSFEQPDKLLPNCWIVIRVDGKGFHKFCNVHAFEKPNDELGLNLMNLAAVAVMQEFNEIILAYGQSDEYSFVFRRDASVYERRKDKLISYLCSLFTSAYLFNWSYIFKDTKTLKYPPVFDSRAVLYPTDQNIRDYLSWRQADLHINNLYNTTFWKLVASGLTNNKAEERLRGTFSSDKNEILFKEFDINYNNEPIMYRKGTILVRKKVIIPDMGKQVKLIVPLFEDMIQDCFWKKHLELLDERMKSNEVFDLGLQSNHVILQYQIEKYKKQREGSQSKLKETSGASI
ncbi:probable tRNA(His) guanylyltransferase [Uranotaenia lowii]|uniref:probable tRNA(His) guanylyltransferase n=1 Tax=Uranotaenia lowii TaxID=190385 RepID=UPI002479A915|nr:probable tRNA(His) guanylyltransferase [Uranotaenia lowii]